MSDETLELTIENATSTTEEEITGDVWELTIETGLRGLTGSGGAGGTVTHLVDVFVEDVDMAGGSFTEIQLVGSISIPRASAVGFVACVVSGASIGIWTITASGPCTAGTALEPGDSISSLTGQIGVAQTLDTITVGQVFVAATVEALGLVADRTNVLETDMPVLDTAILAKAQNHTRAETDARYRTAPAMRLCTPWGGSHDDGAYTTPNVGDFTDGFWIRSTVTPFPMAGYTSPADAAEVYSEIFTITAEGIGVWDIIEKAFLRVYDAAAGVWRTYLFIEITFIGDTSETISLSTYTVSSVGSTSYPITELAEGVAHETAVHFDFDDGTGKWELKLLRRIHNGVPDVVADGAEWELLTRAKGTVVGSVESSIYPWAVGYGSGEVLVDDVQVRNAGPAGTMMAHPTAALAAVAGEGVAFDDAQTNTWTPGPDALIQTFGDSVESVNGATGVVVLDQDDVGDGTTYKQYSDTEKTKLAGIATGATANSSDATLLARANHTGTQAHTTITGLGTLATLSAIPNNGVRCMGRDGYLWDAVSGSQNWTTDTGTAQGGGYVGSEVVNDYVEYVDWLDAGTWTLEIWHITSTSNGIFTITLDGGSAIGATVDGYTASTVRNNRVTRTGISVGTSGLHTLRIACLSKNASSSGYRSGIQAIAWRRTA